MLKFILASQGLSIEKVAAMGLGAVIRRAWAYGDASLYCLLPSVRDEVGQAMNDKQYQAVLRKVGEDLIGAIQMGSNQQNVSMDMVTVMLKDVIQMSSKTFRNLIVRAEQGHPLGECTDEVAEDIITELIEVFSSDEPDITQALNVPGADIERYKLLVSAIRGYIRQLNGPAIFPDLPHLFE